MIDPIFIPTEVTNNGRPMNASLSEDSVAETALSKKNSDGKSKIVILNTYRCPTKINGMFNWNELLFFYKFFIGLRRCDCLLVASSKSLGI